MIEKKQVSKNFSKGAKTYDAYANVQRYMAKKTSDLIEKSLENLEILEIGCGTGIFTEFLLEKNPNAKFTLLDISEEMINVSKEKFKTYKNITYICEDAEQISLEKKYDLILSNASFQWFQNIEKTLLVLKKSLKVNGKIVFSTFAENTYRELRQSIKKLSLKHNYSQKFCSKEELELIIEKNFQEYKIFEENYIEKYKSLMSFLLAIKKIGANSANKDKKILTPSLLKKIEKEYEKAYKTRDKLLVTNHLLFCILKN